MIAEQPCISIVVPACNERSTLPIVIAKLHEALIQFTYEIVIVDDGSTDGTTELVRQLCDQKTLGVFHEKNLGKGAALRTAFQHVLGRIVVIQDADLEYDPMDIIRLVRPILEDHADVVFGSRFGVGAQGTHLRWHRMANGWLTWFSNLLFKLDLTDMETGYKAFRKDIVDKIRIRENGFGVEPELTAKFARLNCRIREVPVSYDGRDYDEGKKIAFRDAVWAAWCICRYRVVD